MHKAQAKTQINYITFSIGGSINPSKKKKKKKWKSFSLKKDLEHNSLINETVYFI